MGQLSILLFILSNLPALTGFSFYFIGWHSVLSLKYIVNYLRKDGQLTGRNIASQIFSYSFLAIVGILLIATVGVIFFDNSSPTSYIFLGLAILTAPHMQVMCEMYDNARYKGVQRNKIFQ